MEISKRFLILMASYTFLFNKNYKLNYLQYIHIFQLFGTTFDKIGITSQALPWAGRSIKTSPYHLICTETTYVCYFKLVN